MLAPLSRFELTSESLVTARRNGTAPRGVTVVIAAYDALPYLDEQLEALAAQTYAGDVEVIVSDNQGSRELRGHLKQHPARERLSLRWVDASQTRGTAHARTVGAQSGQYEFLAFTDQDDRVHPGWLESMIDTARSFDLVGGRLEQASINDAVVNHWRDVSSVDALPVFGDFLAFANGCNIGIWRDVFDDIGGWNSEFVPGEDIEICWRAQLRGYTLGYSSKAVVAYRLRATIGDTWRQALYYMDGEARVAKEFRPSGVRGRPVLHWAVHLLWLMLRCPIFPGNWSRAHRGKWVFSAGIVVGRIRGSIAHRVFYP